MARRDRVLLIGRYEDIANLIRDLLEFELGIHLAVAPDLERAVRECQRHRPGLILLDVDVPHDYDVETALKVVEQARLLLPLDRIPVIGLSAYFTAGQLSRAGFADFVAKPFDIDHFLAVVQKHLPHGEQPVPAIDRS